MKTLKLLIKDMTCVLSDKKVEIALKSQVTRTIIVQVGEIRLDSPSAISSKENSLIRQIESLVFEMIYCSEELPRTKYSDYISKKLGVNYTYLSKLFSKVKSITIEHYIIFHKIERVKQLLLENSLTLSEIAWKLQYSSTAHLAAQFKKVTGQTSSLFRKLHGK